jgi:hypothetical protein
VATGGEKPRDERENQGELAAYERSGREHEDENEINDFRFVPTSLLAEPMIVLSGSTLANRAELDRVHKAVLGDDVGDDDDFVANADVAEAA